MSYRGVGWVMKGLGGMVHAGEGGFSGDTEVGWAFLGWGGS